MSEIINGNGTIPQATVAPSSYIVATASPGLTISSSTNATPIVITTSAAHGFSTGDTIFVEGHLVNTSANGHWAITVTSATQFSLNGSAGNGVGGATGYVQDYAVNPLLTIPDDGDAAVASSINPAFEGLFNLAPFMYERTGKFRLYYTTVNQALSGTPTTTFGSTVTAPNNITWADFTGMTALMGVTPLPVMQPGDYLDLMFSSSYEVVYGTGNTTGILLGLAVSVNGGGRSILLGSARELVQPSFPATSVSVVGSIVSHFRYSPSVPGTYDFGLQILGNATSGTNTVTMKTAWYFKLDHFRPN